MCSCGQSGGSTFSIRNVPVIKSSLPFLEATYCAYKTQFEDIFRKNGIGITRDKLPMLAGLIDRGGDLNGEVKTANGQALKFDAEALLRQIDTQKPENLNCAIS